MNNFNLEEFLSRIRLNPKNSNETTEEKYLRLMKIQPWFEKDVADWQSIYDQEQDLEKKRAYGRILKNFKSMLLGINDEINTVLTIEAKQNENI